MSEAMDARREEAAGQEDGGAVKFYPVGQLLVAARDGEVIGTEVLWGEPVGEPGQAAMVLAELMKSMLDARWVLRQSLRVSKKEVAN